VDKRSSGLIVSAILLASRSILSDFISSKNGGAGNAGSRTNLVVCCSSSFGETSFTVECKSVDGANFRFVPEMESE
jgi:hypothetical protein